MASRCIAKGEEICQVYQGHFGDTTREKRRRILEEVYHFQCRCTACVGEFPLAKDLPNTFSQMADTIIDEKEAESYLKWIKEKMKRFSLDRSCSVFNAKFRTLINLEMECKEAQSHIEIIRNILKILDGYKEAVNDELNILIAKNDIPAVLQLHFDRQKMVSTFLKRPHKMFLSGRMAIANCLWAQYGSISYGTKRSALFGTYL